MESIDLRKAPKYDQCFIAHYCGHHMTCGNSSSLFLELQILEYLKNEIENRTFDHNKYGQFCWSLDIQPANEYKPMTYFDVRIELFKGTAPRISAYPSSYKESISMKQNYMSELMRVYDLTLPAYNMEHAWEQGCAIAKENFG
jgi:hypothetical protein